ncbi:MULTISPECIES: glycosyltransferase [Listeria]|uniref:glycosyltransferase n=1 Tax=Listeria TaxID=1637 RepID=UPI000B59297F|nr:MULTISPECIES: glycosyltransferase [Listeria]
MKVLFFISSFPKLSETFILNQITGFIDRGMDVEILAWNQAVNEADHQAVAKYDLLAKTTFIRIPNSKIKRFLKAIFLFGKLYRQNRQVAIETMKWRKYGQMSSSLRLLYSASYFLSREKANAVVVHYGPNGNIANFYKNLGLLPERTMVFFHGQDITSFVKKWGKDVYRDLFASEISLLPISDYFATKLVEYGANEKCVSVHHMGIDTKEFSYQPSKQQPIIRFLTIGRLTEKKGIETTIEAMALLKSRLDMPFHLDILGDGERKETLLKLIASLDVQDVVTLHGARTQEEVKRAVKKATMVIQLSKTAENGDMEGIPMVLMEAMSRGKIVVSTYHSGIPELIENGKNGFLVPENNPMQAADIIETVLKNKLISWPRISASARETITRDFSLDTWNDTLVKRCKGEKI